MDQAASLASLVPVPLSARNVPQIWVRSSLQALYLVQPVHPSTPDHDHHALHNPLGLGADPTTTPGAAPVRTHSRWPSLAFRTPPVVVWRSC